MGLQYIPAVLPMKSEKDFYILPFNDDMVIAFYYLDGETPVLVTKEMASKIPRADKVFQESLEAYKNIPEKNFVKYGYVNLDMTVVSNISLLYGAAVLLRKDVLESIYRKYGCSDFYTIPSSVHEIITLKISGQEYTDIEYLKSCIKEVNSLKDVVPDDEWLSDSLYLHVPNHQYPALHL